VGLFVVATLLVGALVLYLLIRPFHMTLGSTAEEARRSMPGDEFLKQPSLQATHGITIRAAPEQVWPWLVQMGQGRGGFYSYDKLEQLFGCDIHNVDRVVPELQSLAVGDPISLHPKAPPMTVAEIQPNRAIVLKGGPELQPGMAKDRSWYQLHTYQGYTWAFTLEPQPDGQTRFLARIRVAWNQGFLGHFFRSRCFLEPAHTIMQTKMNQGLKERVEKGLGLSSSPSSSRAIACLFFFGLFCLALFEVLKVYFIMPMGPGSQRIRSLDFAYFLHLGRWFFRIACALAIVFGARSVFARPRRRLTMVAAVLAVALTSGLVGLLNLKLSADQMFKEPAILVFKNRVSSQVDENSVVIGVERGGEARAYPVRFLVYHHQVRDTLGGEPILVTYCSVCRSARVFLPLVEGRLEQFRLVGMDRSNAMFEDATTGSWWRQANGQAVTGPLKGARLPEIGYRQVTLRNWFDMHPTGVVMQADQTKIANFDPAGKYERGESTGSLTRTDPASWQDKSWVLGVEVGGVSKAYDWNRLKRERVINDEVAGQRLVLALARDDNSYAAFVRPAGLGAFTLEGDLLTGGGHSYRFDGVSTTDPSNRLVAVSAHQEFWHSWRDFHPDTQVDTLATPSRLSSPN
jgi:hypothetical protein